mgnify:CR=1 FL=1
MSTINIWYLHTHILITGMDFYDGWGGDLCPRGAFAPISAPVKKPFVPVKMPSQEEVRKFMEKKGYRTIQAAVRDYC